MSHLCLLKIKTRISGWDSHLMPRLSPYTFLTNIDSNCSKNAFKNCGSKIGVIFVKDIWNNAIFKVWNFYIFWCRFSECFEAVWFRVNLWPFGATIIYLLLRSSSFRYLTLIHTYGTWRTMCSKTQPDHTVSFIE